MQRRTLAVAAVLAVLVLAPAAQAAGADQTCVLALTKTDPGTVNAAYPDDSAIYFIGSYAAVPGTRLRIEGDFPHARYMSFNVYDPAARPFAALADLQITPDAGSTNPFVRGADRTTGKRRYTAFVEFGAAPERPAPNTLYTGVGQDGRPNAAGTFIYRIYIPDRGRDDTGGVGIPTVTLEGPDGAPAPASACSGLLKPSGSAVNDAVAGQEGVPAVQDPPADGGPATWRKFVNFVGVASGVIGQENADGLGGRGGYLSNVDNAYLTAGVDRANGRVLVTRLRVPTTPDTRPGTPRMGDGQLRYWSICQNEIASQRFIACVNDDRVPVGADGFATVVLSTPADRPANARAACGVAWIPWGPAQRGVLIYRHMLPRADFAQAVQRAKAGDEARTMGDFVPASRYLPGKAAIESRGCPGPAPGSTTAAGGAAPSLSRTCRSRRSFTVTVRGLRRVRARVDGRRAPVRAGKRRAAVDVDLRGRPREVASVRVTGVTRTGRRVTLTRRFRTCTRRGAA